jgi:hypothetical protein
MGLEKHSAESTKENKPHSGLHERDGFRQRHLNMFQL